MRKGVKYGITFVFGQLFLTAKESNDMMGMIASVLAPAIIMIYDIIIGDDE